MTAIRHLNPISDADASTLLSDAARADLADQILATPIDAPAPAPRRPRPPRHRAVRVRLVAAAAIAAIITAVLLVIPQTKVAHVDVGTGRAQALSFTRHRGYVTVIVRNPFASPATYRREFSVHHLNIKLQMIAASPSLVGTLVAGGSTPGVEIEPIPAHRACLRGPVKTCPVGIRIPVGYHGTANLAFGRAARPGEQYETSAPADAPGEMLHGVDYAGETVGALRRLLHARGDTIAQYRYNHDNYGYALKASQVPDDWQVLSADPWASHELLVEVKPPR